MPRYRMHPLPLPATLMTPEKAALVMRTMDANMLLKPIRYEIAAVIEQLAERATRAEAHLTAGEPERITDFVAEVAQG